MDIKTATTEQLLAEIVGREKTGPETLVTRYAGVWHSVLVRIGDDHTATIRMDEETKQRLEDRANGSD